MKICYFGIYDPQFSRNRIFMSGLRELGVEIVEVRDQTAGWRKWRNLAKALSDLRGEYDAIVVGYPGHIAVPLARFFSHGKPVMADLLGSLSDAERNSHREPGFRGHWKLFKAKAADELATIFAHAVLLESEAQKDYFEQLFGPSEKYKVVYTGAWIAPRSGYRPKPEDFVVMFRGSLTPECGVGHILDAAKRLSARKNIKFKIVGRGRLLGDVESRIRKEKLDNVQINPRRIPDEEFARVYDGVSLSLGQFEENPRLSRTIPHKAYEAFAAGVPYLTGAGQAVQEVVVDGETGFLAPLAEPEALADMIEMLSKDPAALSRVSKKASEVYTESFSPKALGQRILSLIQ
jgi:glycosyltransferase involved in cell wall biosynthesis